MSPRTSSKSTRFPIVINADADQDIRHPAFYSPRQPRASVTCYAPRIATSAVRKLTTKLYDMLQPTYLLLRFLCPVFTIPR